MGKRPDARLKSPAVFLDRDGVINELIFHESPGILESPFTVKQFILRPGAARAIRQINQLGLKAVVISNQPGIALGHLSKKTLQAVTQKMLNTLKREGARLDGIYYCLHHPHGKNGPLKRKCSCRKPKAGLLFQASRDLGIDLKRSFMVGDSIFDVQCGRRAGCATFLTAHLKCDLCHLMARRGVRPDYVVKNLASAVQKVKILTRTR